MTQAFPLERSDELEKSDRAGEILRAGKNLGEQVQRSEPPNSCLPTRA